MINAPGTPGTLVTPGTPGTLGTLGTPNFNQKEDYNYTL